MMDQSFWRIDMSDLKRYSAIAEELSQQAKSQDYYVNGAGDLEREASEAIDTLIKDLVQAKAVIEILKDKFEEADNRLMETLEMLDE